MNTLLRRILIVLPLAFGGLGDGAGVYGQGTNGTPLPKPAAAATPTGGAQPSAAPAVAAPAAASPREAKPDIYYFTDKNGNLQPLVGVALETIEELLGRKEAAAGERRRPDYRFETIAADGSADDRYARLSVKYVIFVDVDGWVRVPLDLQGSVLEKNAAYKGTGNYALQFDAERKEYVAWLQGRSDKPHELTLKTITPLEEVAGQRRLRLSVPRAWSSSLTLTVPQVGLVAAASPGIVLSPVEKQQKQSVLKATGVGGAFQITWGPAEVASRKLQVLLEAKADHVAVVDGRSIAYDAELTVNSFGGEFDRFFVQLPPASVLVEDPQPDLEMTKRAPRDKNDKSIVYEIRRTGGPVKTLSVKLKALRSLEQHQGETTFDFGGFEVLDAVRQWGYLGVVLEDDWQIQWLELNRIRQVDDSPPFLADRNVASVFEYFGRPFTLRARITPRETRISVDPEYRVEVTTNRMFLEAKLRYRVGGAKVFSFAVDSPQWQIDEVGPAEIVDAGAVVLGQNTPLTIPLLQPSAGEFDVTIRAHRDLEAGSKVASFQLPYPRANVVGPATLLVQAAENIELSPRDSLHTGLVRRKRKEVDARDDGRNSWSYAVDGAEAKFTGDLRPLVRSIHVKVKTRLTLARTGGDAEQRFEYLVAREPIDALTFDVPSQLTDKGRLELIFEGKSIPWVVIDEDVGETRPARIRASLPAAQLGAFDVSAKYPLPEEEAVAQASLALRVPLLAPLDGEHVESELRIPAVPGLTVQHVDAAWRKNASAEASAESAYLTTAAATEAMIGIRWDDPTPIHDVSIERLWIQSIAAGTTVQERAVFRLRTAAPTLNFAPPPQATGVALILDGASLEAAEPAADGVIPLRLPASSGSREFVLDVRYRMPRRNLGLTASPATPMLAHVTDLRYVYRQIILPNDECLLNASAEYVPEFSWTWQNMFLVRRPPLTQADLETWCGARHEMSVPERANIYLYSGFGDAPPIEITSVRRTTVVLSASGVVLVFCLGLLYLEPLRRPALMIVAATIALTLGVLYPDAAPLALQAAALGGVLSFTALLLDRNAARRRGRTLRQVVEPPSANVNSSKTRITAAYVPSPASSATAENSGPAGSAV